MTVNSRIVKSQYNLIFSFINNIVVTILGFVTRTVFVHSLGVEYLGLNGLFTNILSVLSFAELGIGNAITFSLYKPIAENNREKIKALMDLYKSAYQIIGWVILGIGICIIPMLKYIVNLDQVIEINYYVIYLMFLGDTVISYWFFAYRSTIIYANQEGYILTKIETYFTVVRSLIQFCVLIIFRNYYIYLLLPIIAGIIKNIVISNIAVKKYPVINEKKGERLSQKEKKIIVDNVFALMLFRVSSVVYSSTDNIIISTWIGTKMVGILSNYMMIINMVTSYVNMFFQSMYASVGNLNVTEKSEYKYTVFKRLQLLNFWIYCYCTICLGCFLNPCIKVWLGGVYCLEQSTVILLALVFFIPGLNNVINIYKDACGLFKEVQYRALATAAINLTVSIVLVVWIGINGVFLGTIIAYLTTVYQVDPKVVFGKVFVRRVGDFYADLMRKMLVFIIGYMTCMIAINYVKIASWMTLFITFFGVSLAVNLYLYLIYRKTEEFQYFQDLLTNRILKSICKNK